MSNFIVQTRSEESGLVNFLTFKEALDQSNKDKSIWKISFTLASGERIRLVRQRGPNGYNWTYKPIIVRKGRKTK